MKISKFPSRGPSVFPGLLLMALLPVTLNAGLTAYLKIPDIPGESKRVDHEDEIDVHDIAWRVARAETDAGTGRTSGAAIVGPLKVSKFIDASSPYLALASMQGRALPNLVLSVRSDSVDATIDYLVITLTNVQVTSYEIKTAGDGDQPSEEVAFVFESITYKYVVQNDDHSAGDEHEITYDIAAGV